MRREITLLFIACTALCMPAYLHNAQSLSTIGAASKTSNKPSSPSSILKSSRKPATRYRKKIQNQLKKYSMYLTAAAVVAGTGIFAAIHKRLNTSSSPTANTTGTPNKHKLNNTESLIACKTIENFAQQPVANIKSGKEPK